MDSLKIKGTIYIEVLDEKNNIIKKETVYNIITNDGLNSFMKAIVGEYSMAVNRMVVGLDSTQEQRTDTKLAERLTHNDISYEIVEHTIVFSTRFPLGSVISNQWIKEIGLAYFDGDNEILITRATIDSDKEIFMTPNNILNLKYQLSIATV